MSGTSKSKGGGEATKPDWLGRLYLAMQLVPRGAVLTAIGPLSLALLAYLGWRFGGATYFDQAMYSITPDRVEVTAQPAWVPGDVKNDVLRSGALDQISLLDRQSTSLIARAFDSHPWVKKTVLVEKQAVGHVRVALSYRRPMAMVLCQSNSALANSDSNRPKDLFYAVDDEGTVLPSEGFVFDDRGLFRIVADDVKPPSVSGAAFGDMRVLEALKLCILLEPKRVEFGLYAIHVLQDDQATGNTQWLLGIMTRDKKQIMWGHVPGKEEPGEPKAAVKLDRLFTFLSSEAAKLPAANTLDLRIP